MCMPVSGATESIKFRAILVSESKIHGYLFVNRNIFCSYLSMLLHIGTDLVWIIGGGGEAGGNG